MIASPKMIINMTSPDYLEVNYPPLSGIQPPLGVRTLLVSQHVSAGHKFDVERAFD
jgi:hypothetical protein